MSTPIWDLIQTQRNIAMGIQEFLYEGKSHKKQFKHHTEEEYQKLLDSLHDLLWQKYHDAEEDILGYD